MNAKAWRSEYLTLHFLQSFRVRCCGALVVRCLARDLPRLLHVATLNAHGDLRPFVNGAFGNV